MFRPDESSKAASDVKDITFEIEPLRAPYFLVQQLQSDGQTWAEVGVVWTFGNSRTNATEFWFLYDSAQSDDRSRAAYRWPGYDPNSNDTTARMNGTDLRLVPSAAPQGLGPNTLAAYLQRTNGVTLTSLRTQVSAYNP